jgi:hypothetical protein
MVDVADRDNDIPIMGMGHCITVTTTTTPHGGVSGGRAR